MTADWEAPTTPYRITESIVDPFRDEFSSDSSAGDSDDTAITDYGHPEGSLDYPGYIRFPLAGAGRAEPAAAEVKVGHWYGPQKEKLCVNQRFLDIVDECEKHFADNPGYDGSIKQENLLLDCLRRALEAIGLGDKLVHLKTDHSIHSQVESTKLITPEWVKLTHHEENETEDGDKIWNDIKAKLQANPPSESKVFGSLRGGAAPETNDGKERRREIRALKRTIGISFTRYRTEWPRLQQDANMAVGDLPNDFNALQIKAPLMYPGDDMGPDLRQKHIDDFRAVLNSNKELYDGLEGATAAEAASRKSAVEQSINTARLKTGEFIVTTVTRDKQRKARFRVLNRSAGNEAFREGLTQAFTLRMLHLIRVGLVNRLFELNAPNITMANIMRAELNYIEALRLHEEVWKEYDTFRRSFWTTNGATLAKVKARTQLRRDLDAYWERRRAATQAALDKFTAGGIDAFAEPESSPEPTPSQTQPATTNTPGTGPGAIPPASSQTAGASAKPPSSTHAGGKSLPGPWARPPPGGGNVLSVPIFPPPRSEGNPGQPTAHGNTGSREEPIELDGSNGEEDGSNGKEDKAQNRDPRSPDERAQDIILDNLLELRRRHEDEKEEVRRENDELDPEDPGNHQAITMNNMNIMAINKTIWDLEVMRNEIQSHRGLDGDAIRAGLKHKYSVPPAHEYWKDTKRIVGPKDLPTTITSYSPGNLPGDHPALGIPKILIGACVNFGKTASERKGGQGAGLPSGITSENNAHESQEAKPPAEQEQPSVEPEPKPPQTTESIYPLRQVLGTFEEYVAGLPGNVKDLNKLREQYEAIDQSIRRLEQMASGEDQATGPEVTTKPSQSTVPPPQPRPRPPASQPQANQLQDSQPQDSKSQESRLLASRATTFKEFLDEGLLDDPDNLVTAYTAYKKTKALQAQAASQSPGNRVPGPGVRPPGNRVPGPGVRPPGNRVPGPGIRPPGNRVPANTQSPNPGTSERQENLFNIASGGSNKPKTEVDPPSDDPGEPTAATQDDGGARSWPSLNDILNKHPKVWTAREMALLRGDFDMYERLMTKRGVAVPGGIRRYFTGSQTPGAKPSNPTGGGKKDDDQKQIGSHTGLPGSGGSTGSPRPATGSGRATGLFPPKPSGTSGLFGPKPGTGGKGFGSPPPGSHATGTSPRPANTPLPKPPSKPASNTPKPGSGSGSGSAPAAGPESGKRPRPGADPEADDPNKRRNTGTGTGTGTGQSSKAERDRRALEPIPNSDGWHDLRYLIKAYRTAHLASSALGQRNAGGKSYAVPVREGRPGYPVPLWIDKRADL
ncbi:hypothetical protein F5Y13DRAFT_203765 [Hypoxylon sp. FL1857]|nr:hypothetical protein F5Y13DRAFT_203765 [Hypoxylon sp. FL1857]